MGLSSSSLGLIGKAGDGRRAFELGLEFAEKGLGPAALETGVTGDTLLGGLLLENGLGSEVGVEGAIGAGLKTHKLKLHHKT